MRVGLIGGSPFPKDWGDWPGFRRLHELDSSAGASTQYGAAAAALVGVGYGDTEIAFLARHGEAHHLLPGEINYRANMTLLAAAGVDVILATHTVGSIAPQLSIGGLVLPDQVIDYTWGRDATFGGAGKIVHVTFDEPFHPGLCTALAKAADAAELAISIGGVYGCSQGPRFESPAEIDRMDRDGCTLVGMTAMPEAPLALELAIPYASISIVVNAAAGRGELDLPSIHAAGARGMIDLRRLLTQLFEQPDLILQ